MAKDLNKVMITGRLGRDPELRYTQSGEAVATFSVASDRAIRDEKEASGFRDQTEWFRVVVWRDMAERITKSLVKGSRVYIEGRLQTQEYVDKQGQKQRSIEVIANDYILLDSRRQQGAGEGGERDGDAIGEAFSSAPAGGNRGASANGNSNNNRGNARPNNSRYNEPDDQSLEPDDIPF